MQDDTAAELREGPMAESPLAGAAIDLRRRPRVREALIQGFLFVCGVLSILTTLGIVFELGKESLGFFTRRVWEDSNKALVAPLDAEATELNLTRGGAGIQDGDLIRIEDEIMLVQNATAETAAVLRGQQGTQAAAHCGGRGPFSRPARVVDRVLHRNQVEPADRPVWHPAPGHRHPDYQLDRHAGCPAAWLGRGRVPE